MPAATILVPTHNHADTLRYSVGSALRQTLDDFELFILGDGCDDATRQIAREIAASDRRVEFLDLPKGPRKGEAHRHAVLGRARGRIVAYLGDDDLWFPDHLERLEKLLRSADFGNSLHAGLDEAGAPFFIPCDLGNAKLRQAMLADLGNRFDFTFGAHTLDAYRRLPGGWHTIPVEAIAADFSMWRQFLSQSWCRAASVMAPTGLCTQTHRRPHLTPAQRAAELAEWARRMALPGFLAEFRELAGEHLNRSAVAAQMSHRRAAAARAKLVAHLAQREAKFARHKARRKAMKQSWSWRATIPLRKLAKLFGA